MQTFILDVINSCTALKNPKKDIFYFQKYILKNGFEMVLLGVRWKCM